jgi:HAD superfamily hydrolase (TIGR01509 family)
VSLSLDEWIQCVGAGPDVWDVFVHLESLVGVPLHREQVTMRRRERFLAMTADIAPMPGVAELLDQARAAAVPLGIASSSSGEWVLGYLRRFGIADRFDHVVTREMVHRPKPAPDLYLAACSGLSADPARTVALEDSVNGVSAALAAGMVCVAVPNRITWDFDLSSAHMVAASLTDLDLDKVKALVNRVSGTART